MSFICFSTSGLCSLAGNLGILLLQASAWKPSLLPTSLGRSWRPGHSRKLPGFQGGPQPGLSALLREACLWRGAAFPGLGLGPCPHFNDRLEPSAFTDWESYMLAWGFLVINSLCRHRSWAVSTSALASELNSPCAVINGQNTPPVYYYRALPCGLALCRINKKHNLCLEDPVPWKPAKHM